MDTKKVLKEIDKRIALIGLEQKRTLTLEEVTQYFGISKSLIYKLSSSRQIPHYKLPSGKKLFFNRKELEEWIYSNKVVSVTDLEVTTNQYLSINS